MRSPSRRMRIKPSRGMSLISIIVGLGILVVVIVLWAIFSRDLSKTFGDFANIFNIFIVVMVIALIGMIAFHAYNVFSKKGAAAFRVESEGAGDVAERLRELTKLRDEGLISKEEFEEKRREIVKEL